MSVRSMIEPSCPTADTISAIAHIIDGRARDLGGVGIRRILPAAARRMVGPFTFFDEMDGRTSVAGQGLDVPPHPHIGLATVTYLLEGEIVHRDSLGSHQTIRPGDVNWMTAGRGIVHSERTAPEQRRPGQRLHGLQLWVALPLAHEETQPSFRHHRRDSLPARDLDGVRLRVLAGTAFGMTSPVETLSPLFYADAAMSAGSVLSLAVDHEERAIYVIEGTIGIGTERTGAGRMLVFVSGTSVTIRADSEAHESRGTRPSSSRCRTDVRVGRKAPKGPSSSRPHVPRRPAFTSRARPVTRRPSVRPLK